MGCSNLDCLSHVKFKIFLLSDKFSVNKTPRISNIEHYCCRLEKYAHHVVPDLSFILLFGCLNIDVGVRRASHTPAGIGHPQHLQAVGPTNKV